MIRIRNNRVRTYLFPIQTTPFFLSRDRRVIGKHGPCRGGKAVSSDEGGQSRGGFICAMAGRSGLQRGQVDADGHRR